jgi:hypothetical protein
MSGSDSCTCEVGRTAAYVLITHLEVVPFCSCAQPFGALQRDKESYRCSFSPKRWLHRGLPSMEFESPVDVACLVPTFMKFP